MSSRPPTPLPELDRFLLGGSWVSTRGCQRTRVISPITEQPICEVPLARTAHLHAAVAAARQCSDHGEWPRLLPSERAVFVARIVEELAARRETLTALAMLESGRTPAAAAGLTEMALQIWRSAVANAQHLEVTHRLPVDDRRRAVMRREPQGVVAAITPWNGPLVLSATKVAAALVAGCAVILRPAPEAPLTMWVLAEALAEAGLPPGTISVLPAGPAVTKRLVAHPDIDMVSFTGSTVVGRRIMATCARSLKRVSLELGGKSAAIVLDDADIDATVPALITASGIRGAGQICTARTRIVVSRRRHDEWVSAIEEALARESFGDQLDPRTTLDPLHTEAQRARVERYIGIGVSEGARLIAGGRRPPSMPTGWYIEPTLFDEVSRSMTIAQEEIFGPVLSVLQYKNEDEAVAIANDSIYGLAGTVFTADEQRGYHIAERVRAGTFQVNTVGPAILQPFGGHKQSGFGLEGGLEGILEFTQLKQIQLPTSRER